MVVESRQEEQDNENEKLRGKGKKQGKHIIFFSVHVSILYVFSTQEVFWFVSSNLHFFL